MSKTFTEDQVIQAIRQWLRFGEQAYDEGWQKGYYSNGGWAAVVLRYHLDCLQMSKNDITIPTLVALLEELLKAGQEWNSVAEKARATIAGLRESR